MTNNKFIINVCNSPKKKKQQNWKCIPTIQDGFKLFLLISQKPKNNEKRSHLKKKPIKNRTIFCRRKKNKL